MSLRMPRTNPRENFPTPVYDGPSDDIRYGHIKLTERARAKFGEYAAATVVMDLGGGMFAVSWNAESNDQRLSDMLAELGGYREGKSMESIEVFVKGGPGASYTAFMFAQALRYAFDLAAATR